MGYVGSRICILCKGKYALILTMRTLLRNALFWTSSVYSTVCHFLQKPITEEGESRLMLCYVIMMESLSKLNCSQTSWCFKFRILQIPDLSKHTIMNQFWKLEEKVHTSKWKCMHQLFLITGQKS